MCQGEGLNLPHCENDAKQSKQETSPHSLAMTTPEVMLEVPDMMLLEKYWHVTKCANEEQKVLGGLVQPAVTTGPKEDESPTVCSAAQTQTWGRLTAISLWAAHSGSFLVLSQAASSWEEQLNGLFLRRSSEKILNLCLSWDKQVA